MKRLGKSGKLNPRFIGPCDILVHFVKVAYKLDFPKDLATLHPVFYVSLLKKCISDPTLVVPLEGLA